MLARTEQQRDLVVYVNAERASAACVEALAGVMCELKPLHLEGRRMEYRGPTIRLTIAP
jgi:hypothetical protein